MEHQDTKLTSMPPRLKELNDNPYLIINCILFPKNIWRFGKEIVTLQRKMCNLLKKYIMEATVFNPVQQHLLRMFAYDGDENRLAEIKTVLADYLSNKIDTKMDSLWDAGILDQNKLDEIRGKDLRTYLR